MKLPIVPILIAFSVACAGSPPMEVTAVTEKHEPVVEPTDASQDGPCALEVLDLQCEVHEDLRRKVTADAATGIVTCEAFCTQDDVAQGRYRAVELDDPPRIVTGENHMGRRTGTWETRAKSLDGHLIESVAYLHGPRHGPFTAYYPDGSVHVSGAYHRELQHGRWLEYTPDGTVRSERSFSKGQPVGTQVYRHDHGTKAAEHHYDVNGMPEGRWCSWLPGGAEIECTEFANGTGVAREHDVAGKLVRETPYVDGDKHGVEVTIDGRRRIEATYTRGARTGPVRELHDGCVVLEKVLVDGREHGPFAEQHCDGGRTITLREGTYCNGHFCGLWTERERGGDVVRVTEYDELSMKLAEAVFDPGGRLAEFWTLDESLRNQRAACYQAVAGGLCCDVRQQAYAVSAQCITDDPDTTEL